MGPLPDAEKAQVIGAEEPQVAVDHKFEASDASPGQSSSRQSAVKASSQLDARYFYACQIECSWFFHPILLGLTMISMPANNLCAWWDAVCGLDLIYAFPTVLLLAGIKNAVCMLIIGWGRKTLATLIIFETVLMQVTMWIIGTTLAGLALGCIMEGIILYCYARRGKMERTRSKYFSAAMVWIIMTQISAYALLRFPQIFAFIPDNFRTLGLPVVANVYSAIGAWSCRWMNRSLLSVSMPISALSGLPYMVTGVSQCFIICSFLPHYRDDWRVDPTFDMTMVGIRWAFAFIGTIGGEVVRRFFLLQRVKFAIETSLGKNPPALQIEPEMDTVFRGAFNAARMQVLSAAITMLGTMPGEAIWCREPLVWVGILLSGVAVFVVDIAVTVYHRIYFPIKGESFMQTQWRLSNALQHFPHLQSDGGKNFEKFKRDFEGENKDDDFTASASMARILSQSWSNHWFFHDARLIQMLAAMIPGSLLTGGVIAVYGYCGMWYPLHHEYCVLE